LKVEIIQILGVAICLLTLGEALALITGLLVFRKPSPKWANGVNISLVLSDFLLGGYLIQKYLGMKDDFNTLLTLLVFMLLIASHSFRSSQTLKHTRNPYCFNWSLKIVNWIQLAGFLGLFFVSAQAFKV
jgi:hypothetical protein